MAGDSRQATPEAAADIGADKPAVNGAYLCRRRWRPFVHRPGHIGQTPQGRRNSPGFRSGRKTLTPIRRHRLWHHPKGILHIIRFFGLETLLLYNLLVIYKYKYIEFITNIYSNQTNI
jgi:hypothetical protein